jgi:hypothetical protein
VISPINSNYPSYCRDRKRRGVVQIYIYNILEHFSICAVLTKRKKPTHPLKNSQFDPAMSWGLGITFGVQLFYLEVSGGIPKSSILVGLSIINYPAIGDIPFMESHLKGQNPTE